MVGLLQANPGMSWSFAAASVIGLSHLRDGLRLQDAKRCFVSVGAQGSEYFFGIASDGAGSARYGGQGAAIICRTVANFVKSEFGDSPAIPDEHEILKWVEVARGRIEKAAKNRELSPRDFAATLVMVIATPEAVLTAHIGDGAVVARDQNTSTWAVLSAPHNGEYASTTYFVTDQPYPSLRIKTHEGPCDAVVVFSDGIEHLGIDKLSGDPSAAFFGPLAIPLEASNIRGRDYVLSGKLVEFLSSDRINEMTDDDKTLIIAVKK
jgi:hypothetical protein